MTNSVFIKFLIDLLNVKIHGDYIQNDEWLLLEREMKNRNLDFTIFTD